MFRWGLIFSLVVLSVYGAQDVCIATPSLSQCANYQMPTSYVNSAITGVCNQMGPMPACTVNTICSSATYSSDEYCSRFSILKEVCTDMSTMSLCSNYTSMCSPTNSVVSQCDAKVLPLPSSLEIQDLINSICTQMNMEACSACGAPSNNMDCPTLQIYSNLCKTMPNMDECKTWSNICELVPDWPICSTDGMSGDDFTPLMQMYLHTDISDYILFKEWVPRTAGQFVGTLLAVCVFGIISEMFKLAKCYCDSKWTYTATSSNDSPDSSTNFDITEDIKVTSSFRARFSQIPFRPKVDILRASLRTVEVFFSILVMLIVMTFNVGVIIALCVGTFIGTLLVGRFIADTPSAKSSNCCDM